jgi:hypothetical protein
MSAAVKPRVHISEVQERRARLSVALTREQRLDKCADDLFAAINGYIHRGIKPLIERLDEQARRIMRLEAEVAVLRGDRE